MCSGLRPEGGAPGLPVPAVVAVGADAVFVVDSGRAKQMLFNFVDSRKSSGSKLGVVYLISGLVPRKGGEDGANVGSCQKVVLVKEKDLDSVKAKFTEVLSEHIYSVQKSQDNVTMTSLCLADKSMTSQLRRASPPSRTRQRCPERRSSCPK